MTYDVFAPFSKPATGSVPIFIHSVPGVGWHDVARVESALLGTKALTASISVNKSINLSISFKTSNLHQIHNVNAIKRRKPPGLRGRGPAQPQGIRDGLGNPLQRGTSQRTPPKRSQYVPITLKGCSGQQLTNHQRTRDRSPTGQPPRWPRTKNPKRRRCTRRTQPCQ